MTTKNIGYDPLKPDKDQPVFEIIKYWAGRGLSIPSIAAKCDYTVAEFMQALDKFKALRTAYDIARSEFESVRVEARHAILTDPETSKGLKAKMTMDDLRTLEAWAPASRTVKVVVEDAAQVFQFDALTEEEQTTIKAAHTPDDTSEENQNKED